MKVRSAIVVGVLAVAGGYTYYDYNTPESTRLRELHELEMLAPNVSIPACFPQVKFSKPFAAAVSVDARAEFSSDRERRVMLKHDCVRGQGGAQVPKLAKLLGEEGVPFFTKIVESCPVVKDEYPAYACLAFDALAATGSAAAVPVFERALADRKAQKNSYLGALQRLLERPDWKTPAQLADLLVNEPDWEASALLLETLRAKRSPTSRAGLEKAYAAQTDETVRGQIKAALLELDNPGRCVAEDEGAGKDGLCHFYCRDTKQWIRFPKAEGVTTCSLVHEALPTQKVDVAQTVPEAASQ